MYYKLAALLTSPSGCKPRTIEATDMNRIVRFEAFKTNKCVKFSREIYRVNAELEAGVSEISSVSIVRVDVANFQMWFIFIPV
jgi:hypothetical protein